jgi:hypothetical protein
VHVGVGELLCDCFDVSVRIKIYLDKKGLIILYSNPQLLYLSPFSFPFVTAPFFNSHKSACCTLHFRCVYQNFSHSLESNIRGCVRGLVICYLLYSKMFCILVAKFTVCDCV